MSRPCKNGTHIYKTGEKFYCLDCGADLRDTDTTAQLRQKLEKTIKAITLAGERNGYYEQYQNASMEVILNHIADYISQLELPEKWQIENPEKEPFRVGFNQAITDTATTLQKAAEQLRRTQ